MKHTLPLLAILLIAPQAALHAAELRVVLRGEQISELAPHGEGNCYAPCIFVEKDKWRLWYGAQGQDGHDRIHYAESFDQGATWTKIGVAVDCGTANHVNDPSVVKAGGRFYMFYTVAQQGIEDAIALAVSFDGRQWQTRGVVLAPGAAGQWDSRFVGRPSVLHDNGVFKMWFDGKPTEQDKALAKIEGGRAVGYATSTDGEHWTRHAANPVFQKGAGAVDVARTPDAYVLLYEGRGGTSIARSTDGLVWLDGGLLLPISGGLADRFGHVTPHIVPIADSWRLFVGAAARQSWDGNAVAEIVDEKMTRELGAKKLPLPNEVLEQAKPNEKARE